MTYQVDIDYPLVIDEETVHYKISPKHRVASPAEGISVWKVDHHSEVMCFKESIEMGYKTDFHSWGLIYIPPLQILGIGKFGSIDTELIMAKFVDSNKNGKWHGYPCYYKRIGDTPPKSVLTLWVEKEIITKSQMSKISQRQVCKI
jgi:hypothetical protein